MSKRFFIEVLAVAVCLTFAHAAPTRAQQPETNSLPENLPGPARLAEPSGPEQAKPPATITLKDAITQAQKVDAQYLGAVNDARNGKEDRLQARDAMLPSVTATSQFLGTKGNGKVPAGRFVTNDGVHVYRAWGVFRQDLSPATYLGTSYRRAKAAEALAEAKAEIAKRGLVVTVTKNYYGLLAAERKYAAAQQALDQARHFLDNTQAAERNGVAAHADVVKAQIQAEQRQQAFDEANLAMEDARLSLAVLLFPTLDENFNVVDDLSTTVLLPNFSDAESMAANKNPVLGAAMASLNQADEEVKAAKGAFLPSFSIETDYGIEANHFALRSVDVQEPQFGPLPTLGYFIQAGVTIPVWDWGSLRSKLHQAENNREQARAELSESQRELLADLYSAYNEALIAGKAVESAQRAAGLGAESLRLINLRYGAGESTALEVVDAQTTATETSMAFADAQVRYRVAIASLQTFTGPF